MKRARPVHLLSAVCMTAVLWSAAPGDSPVADAAMRGDAETVRTLLREGADVNAAQGDGMTALHWAAERGDAVLAEVLLYAGANVGAVTRLGDYTPLHLAAKAGNAPVLETLIVAGSDVDAVTATGGVTALHFASASSSPDAVAVLLRHGAALNARETRWGQTPLMFAVALNRVEAVRVLVEHGADVAVLTKVLDLRAQSGADRAAGQRRDQVLEAFRAQRPDSQVTWRPTARQVQAAVAAAQEGQGVLTAAVEADSVDFEEATPGAMSYVDLVGAEGGLTALLHAAREGHVEAAMALLDGGADVNQVSGSDQSSPMLIALINGHFDLALELLERGADPTLASAAGTTPLYSALNTHWAPKARYPQQQAYQQQNATYLEVMKAVLDAGADPNSRLTKHLWYMGYTFDLLRVDTKGATPFWRAAYATDVEAMKLLLEYGADPSLATERVPARSFGRGRGGPPREDPSGVPPVPVGGPSVYPIHAASGVGYGEGYAGNAHRHVPNGWIPAVRFLIEEHGADVNARDLNGYTPLHHAAARGDNDMIRYLVSQGADVTVVSRRGQTTVDMANGPVQRIQPFPETIALLEGLGAINNHNCVSC
jgi:ankyrin repeat protein